MRTYLFTLALLSPAIGCMSIKPIGPLANPNSTNHRPAEAARGNATATAPQAIATMPQIEEGPRPPRPAYEVTPGEVGEENAKECAMKLRKELEADRISADAMPRYPEVSHIKR
jgi:hypothetical protein